MSKFVDVPGALVDSLWAEVQPYIVRCFDKTAEYRWLPEDIQALIRDGSLQLWLCIDDDGSMCGIVLTELERSPRAPTCNLFMMCGKMPESWRDCLEQMELWARDSGCTHMATLSRPGSAKLVGYSKAMIRTFKEL